MARGAAPGERRGGRAKGTVNKRTRDLIAILDSHGYCPLADLIWGSAVAKKEYERVSEIYDAIQAKRVDADIKTPLQDMAPVYLKQICDNAVDMLPYLYPKRKSIELEGEASDSLTALLKVLADRG
jgi:hypothetical protein